MSPSSKEPKKPKPWANPEMAKAMRDLRRSGAAGVHNDKRFRRARTREASERKAIDDSGES